jgi:hypothetical protein
VIAPGGPQLAFRPLEIEGAVELLSISGETVHE